MKSMDAASHCQFQRDGARRFDAALGASALAELGAATAAVPADRAGVRLHGLAGLQPLLGPGGPIWATAGTALGSDGQPVRAIPFDKTPDMSWPLGWHQDRTIAVVERVEAAGFGPWTIKDGLLHVAPPFALLAGMRRRGSAARAQMARDLAVPPENQHLRMFHNMSYANRGLG